MEIKDNNGRLEIELPAAVDLATATELRDILLEALAQDTSADLALTASTVEHISTAAIQVILAATAGFRAASRHFVLDAPSQPVDTAFRQLGLDQSFDQLTIFA